MLVKAVTVSSPEVAMRLFGKPYSRGTFTLEVAPTPLARALRAHAWRLASATADGLLCAVTGEDTAELLLFVPWSAVGSATYTPPGAAAPLGVRADAGPDATALALPTAAEADEQAAAPRRRRTATAAVAR